MILGTLPETSDGLYDRHKYELVYSNGQSEIYDSWEQLEASGLKFLETIQVSRKCYRSKKKKKSNGGFCRNGCFNTITTITTGVVRRP